MSFLTFLLYAFPALCVAYMGWDVYREGKRLELPPMGCRACGDGLPSAPTEWAYGAKTCPSCTVIVNAELEKMLPAWYTADFVKPEIPPAAVAVDPNRGQLACTNPGANVVLTMDRPGLARRPYLSAKCADCNVDIVHGQMRCMVCEFNGPSHRRTWPARY